MNDHIISTQALSKSYTDGSNTIDILQDINLSIAQGERLAIIGPSGSGKSTLLHLLGGLDKPTSGKILIKNTSWHALNEGKRCQVRNQNLGFIYQFHHLLPEFTALENVSMPLLLAHRRVTQCQQKAQNMLHLVGLESRIHHKPAQLSGGERQRVAIARALVHQPHCVLADEPTGNLDQATANKVFSVMLELNEKMNTALVIVTHDLALARRMDRVMVLGEGRLRPYTE